MLTPLSTPGQSRPPSVERSTESLSAIPHMSTPRCAVGCANLNNSLFVCGKDKKNWFHPSIFWWLLFYQAVTTVVNVCGQLNYTIHCSIAGASCRPCARLVDDLTSPSSKEKSTRSVDVTEPPNWPRLKFTAVITQSGQPCHHWSWPVPMLVCCTFCQWRVRICLDK